MEAIALINLGLLLLETYGPKLQEALDRGEITVEQLAAMKSRIDAMRSGAAFKGIDFKIEP